MAAAVRFDRDGHQYVVNFHYDPDLVALVKTIPHYERSFDPVTKQWRIAAHHAEQLASSMREMGYIVTGLKKPPNSGEKSNWAQTLFRRVGHHRADPVFRALTKVLHPDNGATGDTQLQRELNDARAQLDGGAR